MYSMIRLSSKSLCGMRSKVGQWSTTTSTYGMKYALYIRWWRHWNSYILIKHSDLGLGRKLQANPGKPQETLYPFWRGSSISNPYFVLTEGVPTGESAAKRPLDALARFFLERQRRNDGRTLLSNGAGKAFSCRRRRRCRRHSGLFS